MAGTTFIMPAYNAEAYIENAVHSVLNQTVGELRLIVVDDGSRDRTGAILDRLAAEDARLEPLHVQNGGPARARNLALERLGDEADYVMFLDADDCLLPDALAYALQGAARGADLTVFGFSIRGEDGSLRDYCEPEELLDTSTIGPALGRLYKANLLNQVWGKLFSARLLREHLIRFPDYRWGEDRPLISARLHHSTRFRARPAGKAQHLLHAGESLISKYYEKKFQVCLEIDERAQGLCRVFGVEDDAAFRYMFLKSVFSCLTTLFTPGCPLDREGKRKAAQEIVTSERVRERSTGAEGGMPVKVLAGVLRSGSPGLSLAVFHALAGLSKAAPELFRKIKHRK